MTPIQVSTGKEVESREAAVQSCSKCQPHMQRTYVTLWHIAAGQIEVQDVLCTRENGLVSLQPSQARLSFQTPSTSKVQHQQLIAPYNASHLMLDRSMADVIGYARRACQLRQSCSAVLACLQSKRLYAVSCSSPRIRTGVYGQQVQSNQHMYTAVT